MCRHSGQETTVVRPLRRPAARRVLVCLGFCGGGAGAYARWADQVPEDTDLALVCYPGREGRFTERFARTWEELAIDATRAVMTAAEKPYVLFGHSMGGWMAFDVTTRIERQGGPVPDALIVSSCNAPNRGVTERDRFPRPDDTDVEMLRWMRASGSLADEILADPDLCAMALDLMRADIRVRDSYPPARARTGVATQVLYGADDAVIDPAMTGHWQAVTAGRLRIDRLPGGHFYTPQVWRRLPAYFHGMPHVDAN